MKPDPLPALYLASRSPRRAAYLRLLGVDFRVIDVELDETPAAQEDPAGYVERLARAKAAAGAAAVEEVRPVLAADTTVVADGRILGKPRDADDARDILRRLSGRWHTVLTAVALVGGRSHVLCVATRVQFRPLTALEIDRYWASGEPADKAGAYGIQGLGGALVAGIDGSYSNVVGLPLAETVSLLDAERIPHALSAGT